MYDERVPVRQQVAQLTRLVHLWLLAEIRTDPGVIVWQRPYRVPEARRQAIQEEVQRMLRLGVIEPSRSLWSSPIVMVPKQDGTLRFCNDYRKLNEVSAFDGYPMPRVDELLERLGRARYISTLDLTKGYWQVPLSGEAKEKTAFSTPSGHWQYKVLPFGLHGAPATFQRMMNIILQPHQNYAAAYIDDVVIHSENWEDHLDRLRRVFGELRRAGLTANPKKCHLGLTEAKYLGYQIGRGLIRPQEKKVEAVRSVARPTTKTQVRAFLGLAGYYRCFIPHFASIASPLTDLTKKGHPETLKWTAEAETAFRTLQQVLTSSPVLYAPDFGCPFVLQTDASDTGLGAVLSQVQEGEEHPVTYISRKLTPAETRYA
ncbi:MAG: reverse transcriptase family protein, partial [Aeromonas veronii]